MCSDLIIFLSLARRGLGLSPQPSSLSVAVLVPWPLSVAMRMYRDTVRRAFAGVFAIPSVVAVEGGPGCGSTPCCTSRSLRKLRMDSEVKSSLFVFGMLFVSWVCCVVCDVCDSVMSMDVAIV